MRNPGVIIVASVLLFPSTLAIYGVSQMIFAAKEAVERRAMARGRKAERELIQRELEELEKSGVEVPQEIAKIIDREPSPRT